MRKIIITLILLSFSIAKAQDSHVYNVSHYLVDGSQDVITINHNFMIITHQNYASLYVKNMDINEWLIEAYPLELIETGYKDGGIYFEKYNINKDSNVFIEASEKYETRGYYFFFDNKGGDIKSIAEIIIYSKDRIVTKRYYP